MTSNGAPHVLLLSLRKPISKNINLVMVIWLECRFLDTEVDGSNPGISMLCP